MFGRNKHIEEVVKFIQYGKRKLYLTVKEEGDIGEEYLQIEMRRNKKMKDAEEMNERLVSAVTTLMNEGKISAMIINRNDHKTEE